eukprot:440902-Amphidinium_carterae.1
MRGQDLSELIWDVHGVGPRLEKVGKQEIHGVVEQVRAIWAALRDSLFKGKGSSATGHSCKSLAAVQGSQNGSPEP